VVVPDGAGSMNWDHLRGIAPSNNTVEAPGSHLFLVFIPEAHDAAVCVAVGRMSVLCDIQQNGQGMVGTWLLLFM
jgi:hypothetical protein